jgi:asparagine synthase (glutamine-hydrolysing)
LTGAYDAVRNVFAPVEFGFPPPGDDGPIGAAENGAAPIDAVALLEVTRYMPDQLLRDADQMSMSHSQEVRVPLLDDEVVKLVLSLPPSIRAQPGKTLLARAAGLASLPRKRPFALPFDVWIRGPLNDLVREGLLSEELPFSSLIPREFRSNLWKATEAGRAHWSRAWAVTVLRMWPRANGFNW